MAQDETTKEPEPRLFTRDFVLAIVINLFFGMVFFMLVTGLAVYAVEEFAAGQTAAGFAASSFVVGALFARFFAGKYVNFLGRKRTVIWCLVAYILAGLAYLWVQSYEMLILLRIVHGMAFGFGQTALNAAVFDLIPRKRRGEGSGYYMVANALPPAVGPLLTIQLTQNYGFWAMFLGATALPAVALIAALLIKLPENRPRGLGLRERFMLRPGDVIEPSAFSTASVAMLLGIGFASVMTFLNGFAQTEDMVDAASAFFVVYAAAVLISRLFSGRLQDKLGDNAVVYPALVLYIVSLALLAWTPNEAALLTAGVLSGLGFGSLLPVLQAVIAASLPPHRVSIGISTFFILLDSGFGIAPFLLGPLVEFGSYRIMFGVCAAIVLATTVLYWTVHGRYNVRQGVPRRGR